MRITREWLGENEACEAELNLFVRVFPDALKLP